MIYIVPAIKWTQHAAHLVEPNQYGVIDAIGSQDSTLTNSPNVKNAPGMVMGATTINRILEKNDKDVPESVLEDLVERYFYSLGFVENVLMIMRAIYRSGSRINIFVVFGNKAYTAISRETAKRINKMANLKICYTFEQLTEDTDYNGDKKKLPREVKQRLERTGDEFSQEELEDAIKKIDKLREKLQRDVTKSDEEFGYKGSDYWKKKKDKKKKKFNEDGSLISTKETGTPITKDIWHDARNREKGNLLEIIESTNKSNKKKKDNEFGRDGRSSNVLAWKSIIREWDNRDINVD